MELVNRILLCLYLCVHQVTEAAQLDCDNGCKVAGTKHKLTCTSVSSGNCDWYVGTTRVVSCAAGGTCVSDELGFSGIRISDSHYVLQIDSLTAATFECRLGTDPAVSCTIATDLPTGTLTATCESDLITCGGITNHGTPAVAIELKKESTVLKSTTTGGSVDITQANSAGITYTCAVIGNLANCLSPSSVDVTCPGGSPISAGLVGGTVAGVVILVIIVVVVVVVVVVKRRKRNEAEANGPHSHHSNEAYQHENQRAGNSGERSVLYAFRHVTLNIKYDKSYPYGVGLEKIEHTTFHPRLGRPLPKDEDEDKK